MKDRYVGVASAREAGRSTTRVARLALASLGMLVTGHVPASQPTVDRAADRDTLLRAAESADPRQFGDQFQIYRTLLDRDAGDPDALHGLANLFTTNGIWADCVEHAGRGTRVVSPKQARTYMLLGICQDGLNDKEQALQSLGRAIELAPEDALPLFHRATTFARMGRNEDAKGDLESAIRIDPHFTPAYLNYAKLLDSEFRDGAAVAMYMAFLSLADDPQPLQEAATRIRVLVERQTTTSPDGRIRMNLRLPPGSAVQESALSVALGTTASTVVNDTEAADVMQATLETFLQIIAGLAHKEAGFFSERVLVPLERLHTRGQGGNFVRSIVATAREGR